MPEIIYVGSDHAGFQLKADILKLLAKEFPEAKVEDCGTFGTESCHYPDFAKAVAEKAVKSGGRGVLVCGSGIGMSIAANKVRGVRAALVWDVTSARLSRQHNDANVVCFGARLVGPEVACDIVRTFFKTPFEKGRHADRVELIRRMEEA